MRFAVGVLVGRAVFGPPLMGWQDVAFTDGIAVAAVEGASVGVEEGSKVGSVVGSLVGSHVGV